MKNPINYDVTNIKKTLHLLNLNVTFLCLSLMAVLLSDVIPSVDEHTAHL